MRVALFDEIIDVPYPPPADPSTSPEYLELKKLVEREFAHYFDRNIEIDNWGYIMERGFAHRIIWR